MVSLMFVSGARCFWGIVWQLYLRELGLFLTWSTYYLILVHHFCPKGYTMISRKAPEKYQEIDTLDRVKIHWLYMTRRERPLPAVKLGASPIVHYAWHAKTWLLTHGNYNMVRLLAKSNTSTFSSLHCNTPPHTQALHSVRWPWKLDIIALWTSPSMFIGWVEAPIKWKLP